MSNPALWRRHNAEWLALSLRRLRLLLEQHLVCAPRLPDGRRTLDWLLAGDAAPPVSVEPLDDDLAELERLMAGTSRPPALPALANAAGLDPFETSLLLLAAAPALDAPFGRAFAEIHDDARREHATLHLALHLFTAAAPDERLRAADALLPESPLRALQLVDVLERDDAPLVLQAITVDERMCAYLRGTNRIDARLLGFLREVPPAQATGDGDALAGRIARVGSAPLVELITTDERAGIDVARDTAAALDLRLFELDVRTFAEQATRARDIRLLGREALLGRLALVADATKVERDSATWAAIDDLAAAFAGVLFLVSAERRRVNRDVVTARVAKPTRTDQAAIWRTALGSRGESLNGELDAIVQQFDLSASEIASAVERAGEDTGGAVTADALRAACRERPLPSLDAIAQRITPAFGWDDIVVSDDVRAQLRELAEQVAQRSQVYETWGFGRQLVRGRGIAALFSGPSGVGKTMAAEVLATHLDLDVRRVDLAGVTSKWVGETSKNVRRVFDVAERSGAILLFDEADALFGKRSEVRDSHDRYSNVEIDYLLQRMEDYTGLAILATNRRDSLDPAFLRRLRFVIDFPFPSRDHRRHIWERVFPADAELDGVDYGSLAQLELSGGNIRSIAVNAAFLAAGEHTVIGMPHLARAAAREYAKLAKPVTAAEFGPYYELVKT